ncbi:hypothetical protein Tco_0348223 [Tanacetum coccineum]
MMMKKCNNSTTKLLQAHHMATTLENRHIYLKYDDDSSLDDEDDTKIPHIVFPPRLRALDDLSSLISAFGSLSLSLHDVDKWPCSRDACGMFKGCLSRPFGDVWKWRNKAVNAFLESTRTMVATKDEDVFPSIQRLSRIWSSARGSSSPLDWGCWISSPRSISPQR